MIRRSTWLLLGIFLALLVSVIVMRRLQAQDNDETAPTPTNPPLFNREGLLITGLRISAIDDGLIDLNVDDEGNWTLVNLPAEIADASRIASAITTIEGLNLLTRLEDPPALDLIGLEPANYRIRVRYENGREGTLIIGVKTPTQNGYYVKEEDGTVGIISSFEIDSLLELLTSPPVVKTATPTPTVEGTITPQ